MRAVAARALRETPESMELPRPEPKAGEVLVHLAAAGVNPFDWKILDGILEGKMPHEFPLILGVDGAGVVEGIGAGVTRFQVGDAVFGSFLHAPVGRGTYAEYVTAPESLTLAPLPRGMYPVQGAAVPTSGMTALFALDQLGLSKGQSLLILGAVGGVGSYVVQLASNMGIQALAASRGPNRDYANKLGAHRFFDLSASGFLDDVRVAYPEGVDALLHLVTSGPPLDTYLPIVKRGGKVASTVWAVREPPIQERGLTGENLDMKPRTEYLERLGKEYSLGRLRIPVEEQRALEQAPHLLEMSREGQLRGKFVLKI